MKPSKPFKPLLPLSACLARLALEDDAGASQQAVGALDAVLSCASAGRGLSGGCSRTVATAAERPAAASGGASCSRRVGRRVGALEENAVRNVWRPCGQSEGHLAEGHLLEGHILGSWWRGISLEEHEKEYRMEGHLVEGHIIDMLEGHIISSHRRGV